MAEDSRQTLSTWESQDWAFLMYQPQQEFSSFYPLLFWNLFPDAMTTGKSLQAYLLDSYSFQSLCQTSHFTITTRGHAMQRDVQLLTESFLVKGALCYWLYHIYKVNVQGHQHAKHRVYHSAVSLSSKVNSCFRQNEVVGGQCVSRNSSKNKHKRTKKTIYTKQKAKENNIRKPSIITNM